MTNLYPLKFEPVLKERVWGGQKLRDNYGKNIPGDKKIGESWEISGIQGDISVISNGFLAGNNLEEIVEVYMGDLVGEEIFQQFGIEFPLLIKLIDAGDDLSIQVHPNDELAKKRHHAYGKTEMWYVLEAEKDSKIYTGFNREMDRESYLKSLEEGNINKNLNTEEAAPGDVFYIPPGRIHAIGKGIVLAEIQQTSDITYRIWDWGRKGLDDKPRELHTELSVDAIDYKLYDNYKTSAEPVLNSSSNIMKSKYFTCNIIELDKAISIDYSLNDSFVIYICTEGSAQLKWEDGETLLKKGETILVPAIMEKFDIVPANMARLLEVYLPENKTNEKSKTFINEN